MKSIYIYGSGGFAREVAWLIEEINKEKEKWEIKGFLDDNSDNWGKTINGYKVLGDYTYLKNINKSVYVSIAVGNPKFKENIVNNIGSNELINFATLIHPSVQKSDLIKIGNGTIICAGTILTTNINIGKHVILNLDSTIGHDVVIKDFATVSPSVNISGNVKIGKSVSVGTGSAIIQNTNIGLNSTIGAGAVVIKDIPNNCTAVGVPAKPVSFQNE